MNKFRDLKVWQESIDLAVEIYRLTRNFPPDEKFGLATQMNRSAVSISSNIAEGAGRNNLKEFRQFLGIAQGSACELESQLVISNKLNYVISDELEKHVSKLVHIQNMINKLADKLEIKQ